MKNIIVGLLLSISCLAHAELISLDCMGYISQSIDPVKNPGPQGSVGAAGVPYSRQNDPARFAFKPSQLNQTTYAPISFIVDINKKESSISISSSYYTAPYSYRPAIITEGTYSVNGYTTDELTNQHVVIMINRVTGKFDFVIDMVYTNPTTIYSRRIKGDGKCEKTTSGPPKF
jgi:hypothetical protein